MTRAGNERTITREQAWRLLGADPLFEPKPENRARAANPQQLVALNFQGRLIVADSDSIPPDSPRKRRRYGDLNEDASPERDASTAHELSD